MYMAPEIRSKRVQSVGYGKADSIKGAGHRDTDKWMSLRGSSSIYIPQTTSSTRTYLYIYLWFIKRMTSSIYSALPVSL
jgi:hypothetical protein